MQNKKIQFGCVSEGKTDRIIIRNILAGFYSDENIVLLPLQPNNIETNGNWDKVFKYCQSRRFKDFFQQPNTITIIQIDADVFLRKNVPEKYQIQLENNLSTQKICDKIKEKLVENIGLSFYEEYKERIVFGIAVQETECWLLPIYFENEQKSATENCKTIIEQVMRKRRVKVSRNREGYIKKASESYQNNETILAKYKENPSLKIFIENLEKLNLDFSEEDEWI